MNDPDRIETEVQRPDAIYYSLLGSTEAGRILYVVCVQLPAGRYPVHARQASRRLSERYKVG